MNKKYLILLCAIISIMISNISIGYSEFSNNMKISGGAGGGFYGNAGAYGAGAE